MSSRNAGKITTPVKHRIARPSIRFQLLLLVLAVAVPLLGLVLYSTYAETQHTAEQARMATLNMVQLTAANIEQLLVESEGLLARVAERPQVRALDPDNCDPILRDFPEISPQFAGLGAVDATGQVICSRLAEPGGPLPSIGDRPYFQSLMRTGSFTVGPVQVSRLTGRWVSVLAYPIRDDNDQVAGALILPTDLVSYQAALSQVTTLPGMTLTVIDSQGTVVARSHEPERWVGRDVRGTEIVDTALAEPEGYEEAVGVEGIRRLFAFTSIPGSGWHVYAGVPSDIAFAPARSVLVRQGVLSLLVIFLVATLAIYLQQQIEKPMRTLAWTAEQVSAGNLDVRAPISGPKEFAEVAVQFNKMLDGRAQHVAQLEHRARQLATLGRLGQEIASTLDLDLLLQRVLEQLSPLLPAEAVAILLLDQGDLRLVAASGPLARSLEEQRLPVASSIAGEVVETGVSVWLGDATTRDHLFKGIVERNGYHVQTLQAVPLKLRGATIGFIEAVHSQPDALSRYDLQLLEAAASWIAIAIGNARLFAEVRNGRERLRRLAQQVVTAQEDERRRVSQELHDEAGQALTALKISLDRTRDHLPDELATVRQSIADAADLAEKTMEQIRLLAHALRPPGLESFGLNATLEGLCYNFGQRTNMSINYDGHQLSGLPDVTATTLYRFVQEALTNIARHANASQVQVALRREGDLIRLSVSDDGQGFVVAEKLVPSTGHDGIGLIGMRERLELLGGRLEIDSQHGRGTQITAYAPIA